MRPCPNCGQPVEMRARFCPHCGAVNLPPPGPPEGRLLTGRVWPDRLLGIGIVLLSLFLPAWLVSLVAPSGNLGILPTLTYFAWIIAYAGMRRRYPALATGIGIGLIAMPVLAVLIVLGLLAVCLISAGSKP